MSTATSMQAHPVREQRRGRAGYHGSHPLIRPLGDKFGLSLVDPSLVAELRPMLRAQTAECVMATFGISLVTWGKLRDGKPIRTSVAHRLVARLAIEH